MFHKGASIADPSGLLEGDGKESRVARFANADDIKEKKPFLEAVVKNWIELQDS